MFQIRSLGFQSKTLVYQTKVGLSNQYAFSVPFTISYDWHNIKGNVLVLKEWFANGLLFVLIFLKKIAFYPIRDLGVSSNKKPSFPMQNLGLSNKKQTNMHLAFHLQFYIILYFL